MPAAENNQSLGGEALHALNLFKKGPKRNPSAIMHNTDKRIKAILDLETLRNIQFNLIGQSPAFLDPEKAFFFISCSRFRATAFTILPVIEDGVFQLVVVTRLKLARRFLN